MIFSNATKDIMMGMLSGLIKTSALGLIGSATGIRYSIYAGQIPTKAEIDLIYSSNKVIIAGEPFVSDVDAKIIALGKTQLGTIFVPTVSVQPISRSKRLYKLSGKKLSASASGTASFVVISITQDGIAASAFMIFSVGTTGTDILIKDVAVTDSQTIYLEDVVVDVNLGVMR